MNLITPSQPSRPLRPSRDIPSERYRWCEDNHWRKPCDFVDGTGRVYNRETIVRDAQWRLVKIERRADLTRRTQSQLP